MTVMCGPFHVVLPPTGRGDGKEWWQVNVRSGGVIEHEKFATEAAARDRVAELTPKGAS
jgi:hypothetical protein